MLLSCAQGQQTGDEQARGLVSARACHPHGPDGRPAAACVCIHAQPHARPQVSAIYMWNIISYDVLGVHYFSSSNQGSYRDNTVASMVTNHNSQNRGW
jgi:hypothetical protein